MTLDRKGRVRHWREMAAHALYAAHDATDPHLRATLISLSAVYEELALRAELALPLSDELLAREAPTVEKPDRGSDEQRIARVRAGDPRPMDIRHQDGRIIRSQCSVLPNGGSNGRRYRSHPACR
jgi:hypothetical protein